MDEIRTEKIEVGDIVHVGHWTEEIGIGSYVKILSFPSENQDHLAVETIGERKDGDQQSIFHVRNYDYLELIKKKDEEKYRGWKPMADILNKKEGENGRQTGD